ncbi:MAG TPA: LysR family transcriptional regulator [Pseudomonadales bacterium]|nr:LysR family transcriptional regulator [Pseudomonadales bacterium]
MSSMDWDDLKIFTAIAHHGSVRAAARRLGIHHSTVARRLEHFEKQIGAVMFNRTPDGLKLSADGQLVLLQAEQVEGQIDDIERALVGRDQRLQGHVRLTFPEPVGTGFLMRDLGRFVEAYPDISLDFIGSYESPSLTRGEADIAVRVTDAPPEHLVGRRLGRYAVAIYGSIEYLSGHDPHGEPASCNWVDWTLARSISETLRLDTFPEVASRARSPHAPLQMAAIEAGVGIGVLPCALGDVNPALQRLSEPVVAQEIWLLTHPDLRNAARVRAVMNCIVESFRGNEDLLLGRTHWSSNVARTLMHA